MGSDLYHWPDRHPKAAIIIISIGMVVITFDMLTNGASAWEGIFYINRSVIDLFSGLIGLMVYYILSVEMGDSVNLTKKEGI